MLGVGIVVFWLADTLWIGPDGRRHVVSPAAGSTSDGGSGLYLIALAAWQPARAGAARSEDGELRLIVDAARVRRHRPRPARATAASPSVNLLGDRARRRLAPRRLRARGRRRSARTGDAARLAPRGATDALTGLGNRRELLATSRARSPRPPTRAAVLVLFDLDGFKHYNDTFGHPAGDALLARLGAQPRALLERPRPRLPPRRRRVLRARVRAGARRRRDRRRRRRGALRARRGLRRSALVRPVMLPTTPPNRRAPCGSPTSGCTRRSTRARSSAARERRALRALAERDPDLGDTSTAWPSSPRRSRAARAADRARYASIRHAAELHDVGKVAIPDAILTSRGRSTTPSGRSSAATRSSASASSPPPRRSASVARLVRSTHERFDGSGYPDGLAGRRSRSARASSPSATPTTR